jgi:hypothetical protein
VDGFVEALGRGPDGLLRRVAQRCYAKRTHSCGMVTHRETLGLVMTPSPRGAVQENPNWRKS